MNENPIHSELPDRGTATTLVERLQNKGVELVRLIYSDLHGIARSKDIPVEMLGELLHDGTAFCVAVVDMGLAGNPTNAPGGYPERGYPDMLAKPILSSLAILPWESSTAWCLADLESEHGPLAISPRHFLKQVMARYAQLNLTPVVGPELEFFLLKVDEAGRPARYTDHPSMVYTAGQRSDPQGVVREMLKAARSIGLRATAANHEFFRSQFELNMLHGEALNAADRAFELKTLVKEIAEKHGLLATFMGKPFNDDGGSGFHIHLSINNERQANAFATEQPAEDLSPLARHFIAGVLEHAPALMAFLAPTINAYKRLMPDSLVPTAANWGFDNRTSFIRVPAERGKATRLEIRTADASANPYLIIAGALLAGLDGILRGLEPPAPISGDVSIGEPVGALLPRSLDASLAALQADEHFCKLIGPSLVSAFCAMKQVEVDRYHAYVSDWETNEYLWHL